MNTLFITAGSDENVIFDNEVNYCCSLAGALGRMNERSSVIKPCTCITEKENAEKTESIVIDFDKKNIELSVYKKSFENIELFLIEKEPYFTSERVSCPGYENLLFNRAACELLVRMIKQDTVICSYGTSCAASQIYMRFSEKRSIFKKAKTVHIINNLKSKSTITSEELKLLPEKDDVTSILRLSGKNDLNRAAIIAADRIIVPSVSYCYELRSEAREPRYCHTIRQFGFKFKGINKGIDENTIKREMSMIKYPYDALTLHSKLENKMYIQRLLGLRENAQIPLLIMFCKEKSDMEYSLLTAAVSSISTGGAQTVICVDSEKEDVDIRSHNNDSTKIISTGNIGSKIQLLAGADIYLSIPPSAPSAVDTAYACRFGTVPVVFSTGALKDRISYYDRNTKLGNGFTFNTYNAHDMLYTLWDALGMYRNERDDWTRLMSNAMNCDFSIERNARELMAYISK